MLIADGANACATTDSARLYIGYYNNIVMVRKRQSLKCRQMGLLFIYHKKTQKTQMKPPQRVNVGAPQGCVLSPLLYSLYTHDFVSSHSSTSIVKFADDTVVLGLISNNDETAYLGEVERLTSWCQDNCLSLNVS